MQPCRKVSGLANCRVLLRHSLAHKIADEHEDVATASLLEVFIDEAEKRCWFLFEASRGQDRSGH